MERILIASSLFLSITIVFCMIRAIKGPLAADRLIAVNVIGTKTIILISLISFVLHETYFIDVVLVYALISFIGSIGIADLIDK
ncbi:monovalent cation/H+ antiporter complex subunit F [Tepidibacter hydrothermalis]|uniref:Monovalent cation/H+ antiporter complex subunit F n=1 Tax=Tepidibacter hydrothermalis TaxID=3036126 RepID=A0ABY8E8X0_9FIRM|nr:monovalent cation/H+ antiporter complex subunit F [Tepidibacter hydrothermalis]WFD09322.1 monovalent cation/H+ antiporter complex subunit F [Tepidibacter hydrothermalis]